MAITITPEDIKSFSGCSASDTVINLYINSVSTKVGQCIESSYDEATGTLILLNVISHMLCGASGNKQSISSPNGASISYQTVLTRAGLRSSPWGEQAYLLDTNGCLDALFAKSYLFAVIGN